MNHPLRSLIALSLSIGAGSAVDSPLRLVEGGQDRGFVIASDERLIDAEDDAGRARALPAGIRAQRVRGGATLLRGADATAGLPVLYADGQPRTAANRRYATTGVVVATDAAGARALALADGAKALPTEYPQASIIEFATPELALAAAARWAAAGLRAEPLLLREHLLRSTPNDPQYPSQWHLPLIRADQAWDLNGAGSLFGSGVVISVIDDCVDIAHEDLDENAPALDQNKHRNFNSGPRPANDPSPDNANEDAHGTACAGLVAGRGGNALGVSGVAPRATLYGLRLLAAPFTDASTAQALGWLTAEVGVSNNSWGPPDAGDALNGPGILAANALAAGCATGRGGKGVIYCWAGGNGRGNFDNSNYDGYANSIYTIAVGAVNFAGQQASYSEPGANLLICAPTGEAPAIPGESLLTTDVTGAGGYNPSAYTNTFNGTSGATPVVAGVCALMLQANPNLGWRDVQEVLMRSAFRVDPGDGDWVDNASGVHVNHKYGAGRVDALAAVTLAKTWPGLPAATMRTATRTLTLPIPDGDAGGVSTTLEIAESAASPRLRVEHATLRVQATHPYRGDLAIRLTSPAGTTSVLAEPHPDPNDNLDWVFMTTHAWGESGTGTWTVTVIDGLPGDTGTLRGATLTLHGVAEGAGVAPGVQGNAFTVGTALAGMNVTRQLQVVEDGVTTTDQTAPFSYALNAGTHTLAYTVTDIDGRTRTGSVTVTVPGNRPRIASEPQRVVAEGANLVYAPQADVADFAGTAPTLTYALVPTPGFGPPPAWLGIDAATGQLRTTQPGNLAVPGSAVTVDTHIPITIRITGGGGQDYQELLLLIVNTPGAPG